MAKLMHERIANALKNDRTPDTQLEGLIEEAGESRARDIAAHASASADSINPRLSEEDRDAAAASAERFARNVAALTAAIEELEERLAAKRQSDSRKAAEAERAAAIEERDKLAAEFKALVEPAVAAMVALFPRVAANTERMRRAGAHEPTAEAVARGLSDSLGIGGGPESYLKMKIPAFDGPGRIWPVQEAPVVFDYAGQKQRHVEAEARRKERARAAAEEHARLHGQYRLSTNLAGQFGLVPVRLPGEIVKRTRDLPGAIVIAQDWTGEIAHVDAEKLREVEHLKVERIDNVPPASKRPAMQLAGSF